jgi:hypothetical protein
MKQKSMLMQKYSKTAAKVALVALIIASFQISPLKAQAASVTRLSDTMSRLKASTLSDHEIKFNSPTGIAAGQTVVVTFSAGFTGVNTVAYTDVDFATSNNACQSAPTFSEQTLAASASGATWGAASLSQAVTITSGTGTATAGNCIRIRIGANAVTGSAGASKITNGAIGSNDTVSISGTFGDTGTLSVDIITNDQITVTANIDPTITFTLTDSTPTNNAIGFGTLTSANACYAVANEATTTCTTTDPAAGAAVATVGTNASTGYVLSYYGDTLKAGTDSIAVATISADADGTPGTAQFASSYEVNNGSTVTTAYAKASNNWSYVATTTTTIVSRTTPTATETIKAHFLTNIASSTPAGSYSTTITYIATGSF